MKIKFYIEDITIRPFPGWPDLYTITLNGETYCHCSSKYIASCLEGIFANAQKR